MSHLFVNHIGRSKNSGVEIQERFVFYIYSKIGAESGFFFNQDILHTSQLNLFVFIDLLVIS